MTDRHNINRLRDGADFPAPTDATAGDLGRVVEQLAELAPELLASVVVEQLRVEQYRRTAEYARWIATAAEDLAASLESWMNGPFGEAQQ